MIYFLHFQILWYLLEFDQIQIVIIVIHTIKKKQINCVLQWGDLCSAYAKEAEWYHTGYKPTMEEYINVAWVSISAPLILTHVFYLVSNPIEKEAAESVRNYNDIIRYSSMVLRLANDLGTSPVRTKNLAKICT